MDVTQLLCEDTYFAGFKVVKKLSTNHDGEREVYLAKDSTSKDIILTVFDIKSERYSAYESKFGFVSDAIDEIRFFKENPDLEEIPKFIDSSIDIYEGHSYAWMAQEFVTGESLHSLIRRLGKISVKDALAIAKHVGGVIDTADRFTSGGGHYNISTENILVRYEGDEVADARLIGFSNLAPASIGKSLIDIKGLDKRFCAPEASKGILNRKSDVHSLGMVMLAMLAGYPRIIQTGKYTVDFGDREINMDEVSVMEFYSAQWNKADECISTAMRLILRKATAIYPSNRFNNVEKFFEFLMRFERGNVKYHSVRETDGSGSSGNCAAKTLAAETSDMANEEAEVKTKLKDDSMSPSQGFSMVETKSTETKGGLDNVAGMADLKALFRRDFIRIVKNPNVAKAYGIKPSNCTLLYGPQGCGKTFIAEKAAQESGLKYRIVRPSELGSIYIHGAQQKIAEAFAEAEKKAPMILIFDEFDALVPTRNAEMNDNQANEVNEMLVQLNNCAERGIYCLCTTNRPDRIDPAVMRKGRIDRSVFVSLPDFEARKEMFRLSLEERPIDETIDYEQLASATDNYTCSDITYIAEETARSCFEETIDKGLTQPIPISQERLMKIVKATHSSVSETQRKEYLELKAKMENSEPDNGRKKVGFAVS